MKLYKIYLTIPEEIYNKRIKYLVSKESFEGYHFKKNKKYVYGLYAWTTKKKYIEEFKRTRFMDAFSINKSEIDEDEFEDFKSKYSTLKLDMRKFFYSAEINPDNYDYDSYMLTIKTVNASDINNNIVLTTKQEWIESTQHLRENMEEHYASNISFDYKIFKRHIQEALDILGYTTMFDLHNSTNPESDEYISRSLKAENNYHHNKTVFGNELIKYNNNEYAGLLYLFSYLFFGI